MKKLLLIAAAGAFLWLSSCSTAPYSRWQSSSEKAVDLINNTGDAYLPELSSRPFILDGEIILLEKDTDMIWKNLNEAGFAFENIKSVKSLPVTAADSMLFANTMEVRTYFEKYLTDKDSLIMVEAENGLYYLLLGSKKWIKVDGSRKKFPLVHGFSGPVRR